MSKVISAEELKEKLKKVKYIEAQGMGFTIRKVSLLLLLDEPRQIWDWARSGAEELSEKVKPHLSNPSLHAMRRIILAGLVEPRAVEIDEQDGVPVELILANPQLATELFVEIINLSLGG